MNFNKKQINTNLFASIRVLPFVFICVFLFVFICVPTAEAFTLTRGGNSLGLVGWWTFDGKDISNGKATDVSGNGNTGTLVGSPATSTFYAIGKIGQALNFDGINDYVSAGSVSSSLKTLAFWMKTINVTNKIFNFQAGPSASVSTVSGTITATAWTSPTIYVNGVVTSTITANTWYHVVITSSGSEIATAFDIGRITTGYFPGILDDVRVYNRVLTSAEIKKLYQQGQTKFNVSAKNTLTNGLVGYWTFDGKDISNGQATDVSGNGNTGTLVGSPATSTFYAIGKLGQAFNFDGINDYVRKVSFSPNVYTASLWFKSPIPLDSGASGVTIVSFRSSNDSHIAFGNDSGVCTNEIITIAYTIGATLFRTCVTGTTINTDWHHMVMVWDASLSQYQVYLDGVKQSMVAGASGDASLIPATTLTVGGSVALSSFFRGLIDDVRVYNRVLTSAEIKQLYLMGH